MANRTTKKNRGAKHGTSVPLSWPMDLSEISRSLICIGDGSIYYRNRRDKVTITPMVSAAKIVSEGLDPERFADGIYEKTILAELSTFNRNRSGCHKTNLTHLQDLCISREGQDFDMVFAEYHRWLSNMKNTRCYNQKRAEAKANGESPKSLNRNPATMSEMEKARYREAMRDERMRAEFNDAIRYFNGITKCRSDQIEIQYLLDRTVLKTVKERSDWVHANGQRLAKIGFQELCKEPRWKAKLKPEYRYVPGDVTIMPTGDVFIEFNMVRPKPKKVEP